MRRAPDGLSEGQRIIYQSLVVFNLCSAREEAMRTTSGSKLTTNLKVSDTDTGNW